MYKIIAALFIIVSVTRGEDYYEILGISRSAGQDEIRKAFKKLAIVHHPDKNSDDPDAHDKFVRLTTAYETLKDNDLRKKYDLYGEDGLNNSHKKQTYHSWSYYQNSFIYDDDEHVINLERSDYYESVVNSDSSWFVNFYSPMCSHCHHLAPTWKEVAKLLDGVVKIAAVNCEYNSQLCHQVGIRAYPTLLYFQKNSQHGEHYRGEKTQEAITRFALDGLNSHVPEISESQWELFLRGKNIVQRPMLIFICGDQQNCFTSDERLIVAATFDKLIDVRVFVCKSGNCHDKMSYNVHAVYLPIYNASSWEPIFLDNISNINTLIERLLDQLPSPQELLDNDFEHIRKTKSNVAWLVCFYIGDTANLRDLNLQMKKFSASGVNLGKMNCGRNGQLCSKLGINRYPIWGMLKPGGAFELNHGKNINNDIIKFVQISVKATNVWALSAEETLSILQRNHADEVWFLDWFSPWCPPCIQFLSELRRASLEFDASVIRFGTIDCTVHNTLCHQYNIQYYPTAMLINGSNTHQFTLPKTAANVIQFINEKRNPSVIELTSENFYHKLAKKKSKVIWIVDYFAPWCGPCQRLAPEWMAVAKSLSSLSFVNVASVDCEAEASLCASQGVRSYPNIRMYPLGSEGLNTIALYNGQRDSLSILTWITTFFPKKIHDLNSSDYQKLLNSKHIWLVDFYLPQCWHCQKMEPEFAIAAQLLEKVKFGRINCNFYAHECAHIKVFPTLMLYNSKQKKQNRYDGIKISAATAEVIKDEILEIINSHTKHDEL
ncbi:dnaJ homolog subfamily C member 10-like isoform X1 [Temnothorax curvispinosus]|uniref:DnaJ homolog subfamily C member 10 n=1 Tax=Temnothorax curvispinosus TaxID=300111 RepID=A0A6J1RG48_9HYME|nr:dnaJ homolog subfamily C member 10-like isoform X1 [Temnothorax curvispinosus]